MKAREAGEVQVIIVFAIVALLLIAAFVRFTQTPGSLDAIGDFATELVRPVIGPVVDLINKPAFVYIASCVILLSAIFVIVLYILRLIRPQTSALRKAEFAIQALAKPGPGDWPSACSSVERALKANGVMLSPWATYIQEATDHGRLPTRRFSLFAETDHSNPLSKHSGLMSALPGYYTSLGLILTFLGLVIALHFAAKGFRSGDIAQARIAIVQLLNASAFKFLTSVAALVSALMISVAHRLMVSRLRHQAGNLLAAIDLYLQSARMPSSDGVNNMSQAQKLEEKLDRVIAELVATRQMLDANTALRKHESR